MSKTCLHKLVELTALICLSSDLNFHRFVKSSPKSTVCRNGEESKCIGGLPRILSKAQEILKANPNSIFLNAGDHYQGTLWYNVYRWNATAHFLNELPHDALVSYNKGCVI